VADASLKSPFTRVDPQAVLYFFDEPLIFYSETEIGPLLLLCIDQLENGRRYLAVSSAPPLLKKLRQGEISLRSAFTQPWCWLVTTDTNFVVGSAIGQPFEKIPQHYLPEPGVGLEPHHQPGDTATISSESFLKISFKGKKLGDGVMPFDVFKSLVDEVYSSVKAIFSPVLDKIARGSLSDQMLSRLLYIPVRQPKFASLTISIDLPRIDLTGIRRKTDLDFTNAKIGFEDAWGVFLTEAGQIQDLARQEKVYESFAYNPSKTLEILSQISPSSSSDFDTVEIIGEREGSAFRRVIIDAVEGQQIIDAFSRIRKNSETISGRIVELNLRSNSFVLKSDVGREITCKLRHRGIREAMTFFNEGMPIKVRGTLRERKRRDHLLIDAIILEDGTEIEWETKNRSTGS
jgi:hypothetical protein